MRRAETELKPIGRGEALRRLMQECVVLPELLTKSRVRCLVQWMRTVDCLELTMSSLREAIQLIKECCPPQNSIKFNRALKTNDKE